MCSRSPVSARSGEDHGWLILLFIVNIVSRAIWGIVFVHECVNPSLQRFFYVDCGHPGLSTSSFVECIITC